MESGGDTTCMKRVALPIEVKGNGVTGDVGLEDVFELVKSDGARVVAGGNGAE